jgi:hypothetical protein
MSMRRRVRISRAEAEELLATGVGGPEALTALLFTATPPPAGGEVVGERAALVEFRAARLATVPSPRRHALLKTVVANLAAAKVALSAAAAAAATGGIALAAATGNLPSTAQGPQHANPAAPVAAATVSVTASEAAPSESDEPSSPVGESAAGSAAPSPSLSGLCKAFRAGAADNPGKALQNPAFSVLVAAAGGTNNVAGWCENLVGAAASHGPGSHPTGAPADHPNATNHPTGAPIEHPTGAPSSPGRP